MFDDSEGMGGRLVILGIFSIGKTLYAKIIFNTGAVGASDTDLGWK